MENLYERVKRLAKERNFSIRRLEREAGLSENSIQKWTKYSPHLSNAFAVADVLEISVDELVGRTDRQV